MVTGVETNFKIWMPCELTKAGDGKDEKWGFKGIASTTKRDTDGETLMPSGFDLSYFNESGLVNWNHLSKENPAAIIGEPTMAKIVPEGLYVETELYKTPTAKGVWELAKAMSKKKNSTKKLGFSIEGKVKRRNGTTIDECWIQDIAITPAPINTATWAEIAKSLSASSWTDSSVPPKEETKKSLTLPEAIDYIKKSEGLADNEAEVLAKFIFSCFKE